MSKTKNQNKNQNKAQIFSKNIFYITFSIMLVFAIVSITSLVFASKIVDMRHDEEVGASEEAPIGETEDILNSYINVERRRGGKANAAEIDLGTAQYAGQIVNNQQGETVEIQIETGESIHVVRSVIGSQGISSEDAQNDGIYSETAAISIETENYDFGNSIFVKQQETTKAAQEETSETTSYETKSATIEGIVKSITGRVDEGLVPVTTAASETEETTETEYTGPKSASIVLATLSEVQTPRLEGENKGIFDTLGTFMMQLFDHSGPSTESETVANIKDFSLIQGYTPDIANETKVTKVKRQKVLTLDEQVAILAAQGIATEIKDFPDSTTGLWVKAPAVWDPTSKIWVRAVINPVIEYEEEIVETGVNLASNEEAASSAKGGILGIQYVGAVDPLKYIDTSYGQKKEILAKEQLGFDISNEEKGLYQHEDSLYYILSGGVLATDYMHTTENGERLYFGDDGKQIKNQKIEYNGEYYYFGADGVMAKDQFVYIREEADDGETMVFQPYFFGPGGKAYRAPYGKGTAIRQIGDDKFVFDEQGRALYGYVAADGTIIDANEEPAYETCMYYCGDITYPAVETGWHYYDKFRSDEYDDGKDMWLYFSPTTGRKVYQTGSKVKLEIIEGQRFGFDEYGVLVNGWTKGTVGGKKYFDYEGDGSLVINGWVEAIPSENSSLERNQKMHTDEVMCWFYVSRGAPITKKVRKINGHKYCFDDDGVMQYGFCIVQGDEYIATLDSDETGNLAHTDFIYANTDMCTMTEGQRIMFFDDPYVPEEGEVGYGAEDDSYYLALSGAAVEGKEVEITLSDGTYKFYADNRGGIVGKTITTPIQKNGKFYQNGILLVPQDGKKYGLIREGDDKVDRDGNHTYIVVDSKGKQIKDTKIVAEGGKDGNYIVVVNGKFAGMYSVPIKKIASGWQYKDENKWILAPNNELPEDNKVLDLESYLLNTEEYDGKE